MTHNTSRRMGLRSIAGEAISIRAGATKYMRSMYGRVPIRRKRAASGESSTQAASATAAAATLVRRMSEPEYDAAEPSKKAALKKPRIIDIRPWMGTKSI